MASTRKFPLQAFNWLLRSVSQPVCLHDLLWCLISSFQDAKPLCVEKQPKSKDEAAADKSGMVRFGNAGGGQQQSGGGGGVEEPPAVPAAADGGSRPGAKDKESGFDHPMSDLCLVGGAVKSLPSTFHILLQTISDLMLLLPLGSALQQGWKFMSCSHGQKLFQPASCLLIGHT